MTVAVVMALAVIAGMLGLCAWCVYGRVQASERERASDARAITAEANLERAQFELDVTGKALKAANARADVLEQVLSEEVNASPHPDLAHNDVRQRMLRITSAWTGADKDRLPTPANPTVPEAPAADPPGPVVSPKQV